MADSRTVTIVFTDLVNSTETMSRISGAEAELLRSRHFARVRNSLAVHRGEEVKNLGDGFMAVFRSAVDALACAVTLQRTAVHAREEDPHPISMRIGLSAGEVAVDGADYFGMPVVEASRLCAAAEADQVLCSEMVRLLVASSVTHELRPLGPRALKGLPAPVPVHEVVWEGVDESSLRVALADDSVLLREGIASVLKAEGFDIVVQAGDAESLLQALEASRAHVVVVDVRMPPTNTTEGLDAAERIRGEHPGTGVIVLSAQIEASAAERLLAGGADGIGYLLKDRVGDVAELAAAIRTVAAGGSAIDPEVVAGLVG